MKDFLAKLDSRNICRIDKSDDVAKKIIAPAKYEIDGKNTTRT